MADEEQVVDSAPKATKNSNGLYIVERRRNLGQWMEELPAALHHVPLLSLAIPGSHDAGSYSLDPHSEVAPDQPELYYPSVFMGCFMKHIIMNWTKTQTLAIKQQLESGIRYFDLRIASRGNSNELYVVHGLYGAPVRQILQDVKKFLDEKSREVILLDIQHFYKITPEDHHKLITLLINTFQSSLCPLVGDPNGITLDWMWSRGFQVILFYRDPVAKFHPFLWPARLIPNPWANTVSVTGLLDFLSEKYKERPQGVFYVTQAVLTPSLFYILRHTFGNLKNLLVSPSRPQILHWLQDKVPSGLNVVICDFVDMDKNRLPESVVELNYKNVDEKLQRELEEAAKREEEEKRLEIEMNNNGKNITENKLCEIITRLELV